MIRIYTDKYELDILDSDVSIFKEILDRESIANRSSSWTREISLPNTDNNNEFFETVYKLDIITNRFTKGKRVKCVITDGANILLEGSLQLINTKTVNQHTTYQVIFTGLLIDLMKGLDEYYLNMLDLSEYDHVRNWNNIRDSWDFKIRKYGQTITAREGYVYPDIMYGENGMDGDKYFWDYYPATNVKTVVDKIFDLTGVKYRSKFFTSDYFKSIYVPFSNDRLNEDEEVINNRTSNRSYDPNNQSISDANGWNSLTTKQKPNTPQHGAYNNRDLQLPYNLNVYNYTFFNDKSGLIQQDVQLKDNQDQILQDTFICQAQGEYNINISIPIVPKITYEGISNVSVQYQGGQLDFRWIVYLKRNNGQVEILERNMQPSTFNVDGIHHFDLSDDFIRTDADFPWYDMNTRLDINCNKTKFLDVGDKIYVEIYYKHPVTSWEVYDGGSSVTQNHMRVELVSRRNVGDMFAKFEVKPSSSQGYGNEHISLSNTLPDITAKDFLMSIIQTFNLIIDIDPSSTIEDPVFIIETFDEYYKNGRIITDWKLAEDSEFKQIYNDDIREYYLSYDEDDDYLNEHFTENNKNIYGDFKLYTTDEMSEKVDKLDLIFAPTINSNIRSKNKIVPYLCQFKDDKFVANKTKPRLLFYNGTKSSNYYRVFIKPNFVISEEYVYPYVGMWDDPYNPKHTLEFGNSSKLYYETNAVPQFNLSNQFHQNLKGRVSEEYRIVEGEFYLTPNQFAEHKFSDKILIDNQLYRVLLIDNYTYDIEETLTKVVLEKIVDENYPPIQIESSSCPTDLKLVRTIKGIRFESQNGVIGEDCCIERGGVWNSNTKTCSIPWGKDSVPITVVGPIGGTKPIPGTVEGTIKVPITKPIGNGVGIDDEGSSTGGIIDGGLNESISKYKINTEYITDGTFNDTMNTGSVIPDILLIDGNESITIYETGETKPLKPISEMRPNN